MFARLIKANRVRPNLRRLNNFTKSYLPPRQFIMESGQKATQQNKISVIGSGQLGIACCALLTDRRLTDHLVMMNVRKDWKPEALNFIQLSKAAGSPKVEGCTDCSPTAGSKYIVITVGRRSPEEDRLVIAQETTDILAKVVPTLATYSPSATFIVCSNPVDVMTWAVRKIGGISKGRCISAGCHLDTLRFRYLIARRFGVAASAVNAFIIGEHGNSSVPVWSCVSVGGIPLYRVNPDIGTAYDCENWSDIHQNVVAAGHTALNPRGYINWGTALSVTDIIDAMMENSGRILSVGTDVQGLMGIEDSVVMSLPCVLKANGVRQVAELPLSRFELDSLENTTRTLIKSQSALNF